MSNKQSPATKEELIKQFAINPIAFLRLLGNAHVRADQKPAPNTHLLTWEGGKAHQRNLYEQEVIDLLLEYILKLEVQLAIEANEFRTKSIQEIIEVTQLRGFNKVK
jgi:hypothetical protein